MTVSQVDSNYLPCILFNFQVVVIAGGSVWVSNSKPRFRIFPSKAEEPDSEAGGLPGSLLLSSSDVSGALSTPFADCKVTHRLISRIS